MNSNKQFEIVDDGLFFTSILTMLIAIVSVVEVIVGTLYFNTLFIGGDFREFFFDNPILISVLTIFEANGAIALSGATTILGIKTKREHNFSKVTIIVGLILLVLSIVFVVLCAKIFYLGLA